MTDATTHTGKVENKQNMKDIDIEILKDIDIEILKDIENTSNCP